MRGEIVLKREKKNSMIGKKPPKSVGTKEENQCRKFQVHLAFLLFVDNQSTIAAKGA